MQTYLIAVISHQFQDWRNAQWGKWRPSAEARRQGPLAVLLETRLVRDQLSMDEAIETLRTNHGVVESRAVLEDLAARFPSRPNRAFVPDDVLSSWPAPDGKADRSLDAAEAGSAARRAGDVLEHAFAALSARDQLILRMRFDDDVRVADIARVLELDQKALYRRIDRVLAGLRAALEQAGIGSGDARDVLEHRGFDFVNRAEADHTADVPMPQQPVAAAALGTRGSW